MRANLYLFQLPYTVVDFVSLASSNPFYSRNRLSHIKDVPRARARAQHFSDTPTQRRIEKLRMSKNGKNAHLAATSARRELIASRRSNAFLYACTRDVHTPLLYVPESMHMLFRNCMSRVRCGSRLLIG